MHEEPTFWFRILQLGFYSPELELRKPSWTPSLVTQESGRWTYLVADRSKRGNYFYRETSAEQTSLEQVIVDMAEGQFVDPVRVVGFNIHEGRARDFSAEVARNVVNYARRRNLVLPASASEFVERYELTSKQFA